MNLDKQENPKSVIDSDNLIQDGYPLMQSLQKRPIQLSLNQSLDQHNYSVYDPSETHDQEIGQTQVAVSGTGNLIQSSQPDFNPIPNQKRIKKCGKCLIFLSLATMIVSTIIFMVRMISALTSNGKYKYTDIDGQNLELDLPFNSYLMILLCSFVIFSLIFRQAKLTLWAIRPIQKEYRDAERGVTQGIVMNKRRSKTLVWLKKRIIKITIVTFIFMILRMVYECSLMANTTSQFIDQKYDFIAKHNNTNEPYSVETLKNETNDQTQQYYGPPQGDIKPDEDIIPQDDKPDEDIIPQDDDSYYYNQGEPYRTNAWSKTDTLLELWGHHHGHHGHHGHGKHGRHRDFDQDGEPEEGKKHHHRKDRYKEWLDKLPYMDQQDALMQAQKYNRNQTIGHNVALFFVYALIQGMFLVALKQVIKNQKVIEKQYMGPELITVKQMARVSNVQVARPEPVIQYNMAPQTSATGNIVTANQIA